MNAVWLAGLAVLGVLLLRRYVAVILEAREVVAKVNRVTRRDHADPSHLHD
jgi:hypothetical protein